MDMKSTWQKAVAPWAGAWAVAVGACLVWAGPVMAAEPRWVQVPGVQRLLLGEVEVFALSDKRFVIDVQRLSGMAQQDWPAALARSFKTDPALRGVTAYALRKGARVVLIDAGRGAREGEDFGQVAENLKQAGIAPDEVSAVFLTNLHADRVGGLLDAASQRQFKNARLFASPQAMRHWLTDHHYVRAPDAQKVAFATTITSVMGYVKSGRLKPVDEGVSLMPGLSVLPVPGQAPGSVAYLIESQGQALLIVGDRAATSDAAWRKTLAAAARRNRIVAASHWPFPGFARIRARAGGALRHEPLPMASN